MPKLRDTLTKETTMASLKKAAIIYKMLMAVYVAVLFYLLTPGVLVSLPPGASRMTVAMTHAVVFGVVWAFTHKLVYRALH